MMFLIYYLIESIVISRTYIFLTFQFYTIKKLLLSLVLPDAYNGILMKRKVDSMKPLYEQPMLCPLEPSYLCPLSIQKIKKESDGETEAAALENDVLISQLPRDINRMMSMMNRELSIYYDQLQTYGVPRVISQWIFLSIVTYVFRNAEDYTGTIQQRTSQLLRGLREDAALLFNVLRGYGVPGNLIDDMFRDLIRIILRNMEEEPAPGPRPGPGPGPGPRPSPDPNWSDWEDLGGILTSAPAVASWQANRLDVFGRGQNQALWHKWWDGSRWSNWEDLGGILTSAPGAVSWGPDRIDVFGVGQNQSLWHKWWDGSRWSQWEDLGGILTAAPTVASWQANRLDVFGVGQNQSLWHKWWNGSRWSQWENLGGILTSAPAAVSWGPNRIDVFGRGQNQSLWHIWWDGSRWSDWEDLGGGSITSGPAAASTGTNRLELFARGQRNQLLFRTWNGSRWSSWESLGGVITSEPAAVSWGGRRLDVFARGQNNHLWHIWRT